MKWLVGIGLVLATLALIPPFVVARKRAMLTEKRRIHLIQDMDNQPHYGPQAPNEHFADGRSSRPPIEGTVAHGHLNEDDAYHRGYEIAFDEASGAERPVWVERYPDPIVVDRTFVERGQDRFAIFCLPCHGASGYGDGIVNERASMLRNGGINGTSWTVAKNLHEEAIRTQSTGQIFNTITNGVRTMAGYAAQIPVEDRWAIVAYVKALQRSQHANESDLTAEQRDALGEPVREAAP